MEIKFNLQPNDHVQLSRFWLLRLSRLWITLFLFTLVFNFILTPSHNPISILMNVAVTWGIVLVIFVVFLPLMIRKQAKSDPALTATRTLRISGDSLFQVTTVSETKVYWRGIIEITQSKQHLYFFMSRRLAFIVPKRAFPNPTDAQVFYETALSYWKRAKDQGVHDETTWPPPPTLT